jgi:Domain of unknown function (DUF5615)
VRRVLFDENVPHRLRHDLPEFEIRTVQEEGWGALTNGELLRRAETTFEVLVTADRRMRFQQNLASFSIGIVVVVAPRLGLRTIRPALEAIRAAIARVIRGEIIRVEVAA